MTPNGGPPVGPDGGAPAGPDGTAGDVVDVLVVDDQELIRLGTTMVLGAAGGIRVVGEASDGDQAVARTRELDPHVVLMDVRMPGTDGVEATRRIVASGARAAVLVLTTFDLDEYAFGALEAGASGFLLKDAPPAELVRAVRAVAAGDAVVSPRITRALIERHRGGAGTAGPLGARDARLDLLTEREREVFAAIGRGRTNAEIAAELFLSESTVKTHVGRVLAKLGLRDRVHAAIRAYELGVR